MWGAFAVSLITFHELVYNHRSPIRASKTAGDQLPAGHHRCEPVRAASGLGWYIFLPTSFKLLWSGRKTLISLDDGKTWNKLDAVQYPDFEQKFQAHAPETAKFSSPWMCGMTQFHGIMQIWPGYLIKTAPDYSLLVRSPINMVPDDACQIMEGIVETDRWFGPLFTNIKLIDTGIPIDFRADQPFLQLIPIHRSEYEDEKLNNFTVHEGFDGLTADDWQAFERTIVQPSMNPVGRRQGAYAVAARKRRAEEKRQ
jgi:hypothetical protein